MISSSLFKAESLCTNFKLINASKNKDVDVCGVICELKRVRADFVLFSLESVNGDIMQLAKLGDIPEALKENTEVVVTGKVQERFNEPDVWQLSPSMIVSVDEFLKNKS